MSTATVVDEWVWINGREARAIRDVNELLTLESWRLRWHEELGAWLYFPPAADRAAV